ncbi:MAG: hypothetical protein V5A31_13145 [Haloferacaceae archaeon]|jgi:hypothetical protein
MSDDEGDTTDDQPLAGRLREGYRTVTPSYLPHPDAGMDAVGWTSLALLVVLFVPFLPLIAVVWFLSKVVEFLAAVPGED